MDEGKKTIDEEMTTGGPAEQEAGRLTIRVGRSSLMFLQPDKQAENGLLFEPYNCRSGVSVPANLREAFTESPLLSRCPATTRTQVLVDAPVMLVPVEEFAQQQTESLFRHTFTTGNSDVVTWTVIPSLNAVAVYAVNKDLKLVVEDHFSEVRWSHVCIPVWTHLHRRSFTGLRRKMYAYFHDRRMDLFSFQQNRFRFANSYEASRVADVVFFVLSVWKMLGLNEKTDELHMVGDIQHKDMLQEELHQYVQNVYVINPTADFNRAPATKVSGLTYDLVCGAARLKGNE